MPSVGSYRGLCDTSRCSSRRACDNEFEHRQLVRQLQPRGSDNRPSIERLIHMNKAIAYGAAAWMAVAMGGNVAVAADETETQSTTTTVWVDGKGQGSMAREVNKVHDKMSAQGWRYADMNVYIEDGDMKGIFVTYIRNPVPAATPAP